MDLMQSKPDNYYDLAIVDPPYGIDVNKMNMGGRSFKPTAKSWDFEIPDSTYFNELLRVSKNCVVWGGNYFTEHLPASQYFSIWDKGETMYGRDFAECEYAWVRSGGTRIYKKNPNQQNRIHPTQKPVKLYEWLLMNYAKEGDKILDTHGGSGSICLACHNLGFSLDWIELDEDYYQSACKRYDRHIRQLRMFQ